MGTINANSSMSQPVSILETLWRKSKTLLIVSALLGLISLNVLTLLNDAIHAAGYNALKTILASALPDATVSRMLRASPTTKRRGEVMRATKALSNENAKLAASNKAIEKKRIALERANKKIGAEHAVLKSISGKQTLTAQKISKRLATRSLANATRNASSVAGEAIPLIGTAIIVGVTAWDVHDACETMKDINELNGAFGHAKEDQTRVCGLKVPSQEQVLAQVKANWKMAYQTAADSVNRAGDAMIPTTPPHLSWPDIRGSVCSVVGSLPGLCP